MPPFIKKYMKVFLSVCKTTWLIGPFIQHLTHFWLDFLGLFLDMEVQTSTSSHYFW